MFKFLFQEPQRKLFLFAKLNLKIYLTLNQNPIKACDVAALMYEEIGVKVDFEAMGLTCFGQFLYHCQDVFRVTKDDDDVLWLSLRGEPDPKIRHLLLPPLSDKQSRQLQSEAPAEDLLEIYYNLIDVTNNKKEMGHDPGEEVISKLVDEFRAHLQV